MLIDKLVNAIATFKKKASYARLNRYKHDPKLIQTKILLQTIKENRATLFGKEHHFGEINSYEDFRQQVPVRTSAQYATYLNRVYHGEQNVITKESPYFFAMTTGSTGDYKYIPITKKARAQTNNSILVFVYFMEQHFPAMKSNPIQFLVGSGDGGVSPGGVPQGFVSGFNYKHLPSAITDRFIIPYWVFTLENMLDRYYAMARFMVNADNLVALGAISPLLIVNVAEAVLNNIERLTLDMCNQTLTLSADSQGLAARHDFSVDPVKIEALKAYQNSPTPDKRKLMAILFNRLQYLVTWAGGNMSYSLTEAERYFGRKQMFEMPFSASEGTFAIPWTPNARGGIAGVTGHFLEFIPEDQIDLENPVVLPVWEVEEGKTYYQVITTAGGLYRYNMEDLVLITGFWGKVPIVEFISKKARQVSINNERITEKDVTDVINTVCTQLGVHFDHFILFPSHGRFYLLVVDQDLPNMDQFLQAVEAELRRISMGYNWERRGLRLHPMRIMVVDKDILAQHVHSHQFKSKLPSGQFKPLHLSNVFDGHEIFEAKKEYTTGDCQ
jgi:hypothetical protein